MNTHNPFPKQEPGAPSVKTESEFSPLSDPEDYLEENESLDMNLTTGNQKVWFVKLPRYLAEKWTNPANLNGQQLGQVKIRNNSGPNGKRKLEVKLVLADNEDESVPQEYDLRILNTHVQNSYVFSEENLTRFKQEVTEVSEIANQPELKEFDDQSEEVARPNQYFRVLKNGENGEKKFIPFVKTIPKKTSLVGKIVHDCQIVPLKSDRRYALVLATRLRMPLTQERPKVTFLDDIPGVVQSQAGPSISGRGMSMFLKSNPPRNKADGRATRMPKKDLLDLLFRLFEDYPYWSLKGLKDRTRQPETYLKECVELIGNLVKKGPYTSKYTLKPEYKRLRDAERAARLGQAIDDDNDNKDDDDDIEMEDII